MSETSYDIKPLTPETWPAFDDLVIRHNGIFGGCYCIWFHPDGPERGPGQGGQPGTQEFLRRGRQAHAALVIDGDEAIAWAEYGTPAELPSSTTASSTTPRRTPTPTGGSPACSSTALPPPQGLVEVAIRGALDLIAESGGGVVEAYPHDLTDQTKKMSSSFLYNGTRRLYERLGFTYVRPKGLKNCVMTTTVAAR